jgi:hypothetical protein
MAVTELEGTLSRVDISVCNLWLDESDGETHQYEFETTLGSADYYLMVSRKVKLTLDDGIVKVVEIIDG